MEHTASLWGAANKKNRVRRMPLFKTDAAYTFSQWTSRTNGVQFNDQIFDRYKFIWPQPWRFLVHPSMSQKAGGYIKLYIL